MLECFYPDHEMACAYEIAYEALYEEGYRGIIFDIDNTLVPHGAPADNMSDSLFARLKVFVFENLLLYNN